MITSEQILEFDKIKELWANLALTNTAKEKIQHTVPCLTERELLALQKQTTEAKKMLEKCGTPPLTSFAGISELIDTAEKEGCLTPSQFETLESNLSAIKRLKDYLDRCKSFDLSLAYYEENLDSCFELREAIHQQIRNRQVDDYASPLLCSIRKKLVQENSKMHEKAEQIMRSNKSYLADSFSTIRNGRICIPVKKECRQKINGTVLDKSASGNTLLIEPASLSKHFETIQLLKINEENEELRIRYILTAMVLDVLPAILQNQTTVERLDFAFSKGKLSLYYDGIEPIINTDRRIRLTDARHPLMEKNRCVPLNFSMGEPIHGVIITGPNTGGKTVSLKTVALCCMMAQCGLHIPCQEADICMNSNYLCDIGDGQNLSENLSTFSAHLTNILHILDEVNEESLVILDELGSGTDPTEGMGIAIAVLEELRKSGALFLVTTHYPEIKQYAKEKPDIINARMDFDKETLTPLYKLIIGESGESCAFSIAKRLGMSEEMLAVAAQAAYGNTDRSVRANTRIPQPFAESMDAAAEKQGFVFTADVQKQTSGPKIIRQKQSTISMKNPALQFHLGDSVMVFPDKKIGIVCQTANEKGILRVQMPDKKIWINHKRLKLHVPATELYPEDYDFSIIFDTVENRKLRHQMERKYVDGATLETE